MKTRSMLLLLLAFAAQAASAAQIITVSKFQFGKQWAFTKEEVQLLCRPDGSLFALNMSTLMQYPLNQQATHAMTSGQVNATSIDGILLDDPDNPGEKMSIAPFAERAGQLCDAPK
ncbi:YebY family protein [Acerihabitans arboris]|uniref:DUF2511 domain-containing protein n=1 Tax=Acerihabitans arboris TaxID=2691583 RepID=A0A845SF87_9GAMM|nr:YebY family protein [Acerihabitans arboris]NDL62539.1 DUF2511 domain-containing protein [Acerihabitans arboris]